MYNCCSTILKVLDLFVLAPGFPYNISIVEGSDPQTTMEIFWNKPDGGDAIDTYELQWMPTLSSSLPQPESVDHKPYQERYKQNKSDLTPGESYVVIVGAKNKVGWNNLSKNFTTGMHLCKLILKSSKICKLCSRCCFMPQV